MRDALESPNLDVTATQRQVGALEQSAQAQFTVLRTLGGTTDASFSFGLRTNRPPSGAEGDRFLATDIGAIGGWLYYWSGTAWEIVVGWASGTDAQRSALSVSATDNGAWFYATDTTKFWEVAGGAWADRTPPSGASSAAQFVTVVADIGLANERVLTGTASQIVITDNGAGSTVVISMPATVSLGTALQIAGTQVVNARKTGWTAPTGTPSRAGFATSTATLTQLAETLKALYDDLASHGLIGT